MDDQMCLTPRSTQCKLIILSDTCSNYSIKISYIEFSLEKWHLLCAEMYWFTFGIRSALSMTFNTLCKTLTSIWDISSFFSRNRNKSNIDFILESCPLGTKEVRVNLIDLNSSSSISSPISNNNTLKRDIQVNQSVHIICIQRMNIVTL